MFEVESTRSVAVHPLPPDAGGIPGSSALVAEHLDTLLGERLLPLRLREGDADEPYLLAVDAAGQPVVVEICAVLDELAVMRALRHAGRAASMSTQDLARVYRGGSERFAAHLAAFRETVPATALLSTSVRSSARLLLVCSAIAEGMEDVVEFLLQPGWQVDVLQVGVVPGADGARIVDVAPLTRTPPPRRAMEPTLRMVRTAEQQHAPREQHGPRLTPPRGTASAHPGGSSGPGQGGQGSWRTLARPAPARPVADPMRRMPSVAPPPFAVRAPGRAPEPAARETHEPLPVHVPVRPDHRLARVAEYVGGPVALVWEHGYRGEYHEALLHGDGWIELANGLRFRSPDEAALAVAGEDVDGWEVWRLERGDGPSLWDVLVRASA